MASLTDTARWRAISPHLDRALDLPVEAREPFLAQLRATDPALAADLASLLAERDTMNRAGFLENPPVVIHTEFGSSGS